MRKRAKKLALTLVLSVSLLSMNMNFVYAEEMGLSENPAIGTDTAESSTITDSIDTTGETEAVTEGTDNGTDVSVVDENAGQSETGENKDESVAGESVTDGTASESQETDGSGETGEDADGTDADGAAAADTTDEETSEKVYINQDGEEVIPSTLVGVDYDTIADNYDGITDVLKQYIVSDEYPENTITQSYVDENGNLVLVISQGAASTTETEEKETGLLATIADALRLDAEMGGSGSAPAVDGSFTGWDDIPISYEQNHDDSGNCWVNGFWITDPETGETKQHILEQGTYDNIARHEMQLYCDGDNVYLKITYAAIYGGIWAFSPDDNEKAAHGNGEDFQFYIDGVDTKFQITQQGNGEPITNWKPEAGTYVVDVRNGNYDPSFSIVDGAAAYYHVTENGVNNSLELKIPMEAFQAQNGSVNLDNFNMVQFFTPNLMLERLTAAGSPTGAVPFSAAVFLLVPASYVWLKRKDDKEDMAFA